LLGAACHLLLLLLLLPLLLLVHPSVVLLSCGSPLGASRPQRAVVGHAQKACWAAPHMLPFAGHHQLL
jgi:hypothetical protein